MTTPNYALKVANESEPLDGFYFLQDAIKLGLFLNKPFTVEMLTPNMTICEWQPGMARVKYTDEYKAWYEDQQKELGRISG